MISICIFFIINLIFVYIYRQDYLEHPGLIYRDSREIESRAAAAAAAAAAIHDRDIIDHRDRDQRDFALQLAAPPIAHQAEPYPSNSRQVAAAIAAQASAAHHSTR